METLEGCLKWIPWCDRVEVEVTCERDSIRFYMKRMHAAKLCVDPLFRTRKWKLPRTVHTAIRGGHVNTLRRSASIIEDDFQCLLNAAACRLHRINRRLHRIIEEPHGDYTVSTGNALTR